MPKHKSGDYKSLIS